MPTKWCSLTRVALASRAGCNWTEPSGRDVRIGLFVFYWRKISNVPLVKLQRWRLISITRETGSETLLPSVLVLDLSWKVHSRSCLPPHPLTSQQGAFLVSARLHGASRWNVIKFHQRLILRKHSYTQSIWIKAKQRTQLSAPPPPFSGGSSVASFSPSLLAFLLFCVPQTS